MERFKLNENSIKAIENYFNERYSKDQAYLCQNKVLIEALFDLARLLEKNEGDWVMGGIVDALQDYKDLLDCCFKD